MRDGARLFIRDAVKAVARTHAQAFTLDFDRERVKATAARLRIEGRFFRAIADQVKALLIVKHTAYPAAQIVRIAYGEPTRLLCQILRAAMRLEKIVAALAQSLFDLGRTAVCQI